MVSNKIWTFAIAIKRHWRISSNAFHTTACISWEIMFSKMTDSQKKPLRTVTLIPQVTVMGADLSGMVRPYRQASQGY